MRVAAGGLLGLGWLVTFVIEPWSDETVNDLLVYRGYAEAFLDGHLPYRDVPFEYPPLAAVPLALGALAGTGPDEYRLVFGLLVLVAAGATLAATGMVAGRTGGSEAKALLGLAALPLLAGAMVRTHFDLVPVAIAVGALAALLAGRPRVAFALIGIGAMTKGFPLLIAPVALAWLAGRGRRRDAIAGLATLVAVLAALGAAWLAVSPRGAWEAVSYHLERPVQVESLPATGVYALERLGAPAAERLSSHRSDGIAHPAAEPLAAATLAGLLLILAAVCAMAARRGADERALVLGSLTAIAAFATLGKVLSPQFLIWVAPLGALALAWRMHALAAAVAAATVLTLAEFPSRYFDVVAGEPAALALVGARNAALLAALGLAAAAMSRLTVSRPPAAAAARSRRHGHPVRP